MDRKTELYILNILRKGTIAWHGRTDCLNKSRKRFLVGEFKNGNPKYLFKYPCAKCEKWFVRQEVDVDHIDEVGPYQGDLHAYSKRLYCDQENLQILCKSCHKRKTSMYNSRIKRKPKV